MRWLFFLLACLVSSAWGAEKLRLVNASAYSGMADASGAVAVGTNLFLAADDENNTLGLYRADQPGPPLKEFDLNDFLLPLGKSVEADLEAGARIANRAYWIGSHGRNKNGKERPNRGCFFATDLQVLGQDVVLTPVGRPYGKLLQDFLRDARLAQFRLAEAAERAPKTRDALNIEGLSATPENHLLVGFRNPIPDGKALIVPLLNPDEVIQGHSARLGAPIQLDLNGLGIRDIALFEHVYVIIAGSYHGGGKFEMFKWVGGDSQPQRLKVNHLNRYHPEAIILYPNKGLSEFQVLSDDGTEPVAGIPGKLVKDPAAKTFRSFWLVQEE